MSTFSFIVRQPIVRQGRELAPGAEFSISSKSSRVHVERWLSEGKIDAHTNDTMQMQTKTVNPGVGMFTRGPEKKAAVTPIRKSVATACSSKNGEKTSAVPTTVKEVSAQLDKILAAAVSASGCKSEAEFNKLPKEERNAFMAQASGTARTQGEVSGVLMLDPKTIRRSPFNRLIDEDDPEFIDLVADVAQRGVLQNGVVRTASEPREKGILWEIIAGEGRWEAALRAKQKFPAVVREVNDTEAIEIQAIENMKRRNLNPMDEATKYEQLRIAYEKDGLNRTQAIDRIHEKTGKAPATIYERLTLIKLPSQTQVLVRRGLVPASHAGLLGKLDNPVNIIAVAGKIAGDKGGMSFRDAELLVKGTRQLERNLTDYKKKEAEFTAKGWPILTLAKSKELLDCHENGNWWLNQGNRETYVRANEMCHLPGADWKSYEKLWKTPPTPTLGRLPDDRAVFIYPKADADAAVQKGGKIKKSTNGRASSRPESELRAEREHRARCTEFTGVVGAVVKGIETTLDSKEFWQFFALMLVRQWRSDPLKRTVKRRGVDKNLATLVPTLGVGELRGLCAEILLYADAPSQYCGRWGDSLQTAVQLLKLPALSPWGKKDKSQTSGDDEEEDHDGF